MPPLPAVSTLKKGVVALIRQWSSHYAGAISANKFSNMKKDVLPTVDGVYYDRKGVEMKRYIYY